MGAAIGLLFQMVLLAGLLALFLIIAVPLGVIIFAVFIAVFAVPAKAALAFPVLSAGIALASVAGLA